MTVATYQLPEVVSVAELCRHSYRDFHAKGFDYLCLERSAERTLKVYFFDGEASTKAQVVMPHDHRYSFMSGVVAGEITNHSYVRTDHYSKCGDVSLYDEFEYRTPLNGGSGFEWKTESLLKRAFVTKMTGASRPFHQRSKDIHTISVTPGSVLSQVQRADEIPIGKPTAAFRLYGARVPPELDGLYREMDADHALARLATFYELAGLSQPRVVE